MHELERLFPDLVPPPDGLARLQRTIAGEPTVPRVRHQRWTWALAACVPVAILAMWLPQRIVHQQCAAEIFEAMRRNVSPPADDIRVANGAAIELSSGQANVRLYLVQSVSPLTRGSSMQERHANDQNDMK